MDSVNYTSAPNIHPWRSHSAYLWCVADHRGFLDWNTVAETRRGAWERAYKNASQHGGQDLGEWRTYMQRHAGRKAVKFYVQCH